MKKKLTTVEELRRKNNYTYLQIAQMLNCSKTYTWQLITGKRRMNYEQAIIIASIFNMKPDELFYTDFMNEELESKINGLKERKKQITNEK